MYRGSLTVSMFAERIGTKYPTAVGLIVLLKELDAENGLDAIPESSLWSALGGRLRGVSHEYILAAYREYELEDRRMKDRERQRRRRGSSRPERDIVRETSQSERDIVRDMSRPERDIVRETSQSERDIVRETSQSERDIVRDMSRPERDGGPSLPPPVPAPFRSPSPPAPPVTPHYPPVPDPRPSLPVKKIDVDDNWKRSIKARGATAQRIVNEIVKAGYPCRDCISLYDIVLRGLESMMSPDDIMNVAENAQNWADFAAMLACMPVH